MFRTTTGFLALLALLPALQARDKADTPTPVQRYEALEKEYQTAKEDFLKAVKEAKTAQEQQKVYRDKYPQPAKFAPRFLKLAEQNPKAPVAVDALIWVVSNAPGGGGAENPQKKAVKILLRDHIQSEKMAKVCPRLAQSYDEDSRHLLRAVLEKNPHRSAKAQACFALAQQTENRVRLARRFKEQPDSAKSYEAFLGKEAVEALVKAGPDKLSKEAEALYERIDKDFADATNAQGEKLGKLAKDKLDALRHPVVVGKPAPEIEAEDIDGKKFKLSDYRGKVVMLDFWGHW
jgi:hypothetical protein